MLNIWYAILAIFITLVFFVGVFLAWLFTKKVYEKKINDLTTTQEEELVTVTHTPFFRDDEPTDGWILNSDGRFEKVENVTW